jgi:hypothetical protein
MAAGLGFKTFNTGDVLSAADTNGYLMQGVLVFADATARNAAITSPQEGQFAYLKDTNVTTYYTGSAWANLDTTGMTNPMTTTGDTIYSSSGSTPARLGIGTTGQVLTVAGGVPSWATPAGGGGKVLQVVYASYSTDVTITSNGSYRDTGLEGTITPSAATSKVLIFTNIPISWTRPARDGGLTVRLLRGATSVFEPAPTLTTEFFYFDASTGGNVLMKMQAGLQYLDSPSTTSATTYKQQFNNTYATSTATAQQNAVTSTMILMEIGA